MIIDIRTKPTETTDGYCAEAFDENGSCVAQAIQDNEEDAVALCKRRVSGIIPYKGKWLKWRVVWSS